MELIHSFFGALARWLGFVGSCTIGPNATCVPFLAFFALALAAGAALWLILRAYRRLQGDDEERAEERRARAEQLRVQRRIRQSVAAHVEPRPVAHRGWRMPA